MNPTERSSVPSCIACASAGVAVNVMSGSSAGAPSPFSSSLPSATRTQPRACSFFPAATTKATTVGSGTVDRGRAEAGEEIVLVLAFRDAGVDQRARELELLPGEHL